MSDVQGSTLQQGSIVDFLEQLTLTGAKLLSEDGSVACGLMLKRDNGQAVFCSASPTVTEMYQLLDSQHAVGQGPVRQALSAAALQVADDTSDPRHPPFFRVPAALGFASILSIPLTVGPGTSAALNFYAPTVAFFTTDRQRVASVFAEQAAVSVLMSLELAQYQDLTVNMRSAMESRTSIDMAIGIIIAQNRCTQEEASAILKRASNARNVKLRNLTQDIVAQTSGGTPRTHFTT